MPKKILIIPPHKWYMEAQAEYIVRYLSDEFIFDIAQLPYPPYSNYKDRFPAESPFFRNPDDYDLIWPLLPTHWQLDHDEYRHKIATVFYSPNEGDFTNIATVGATNPYIEKAFQESGQSYYSLRFGVDTNLFKPYPMVREDNLFHVGMVGTLGNSRRMIQYLAPVLKAIPGVKLMLWLNMSPRSEKELKEVGGDLNLIMGGDKWWPGLPNIYNQLDVLIRCDQDPGYSFPVLEAAACGVPVIATDCGIDHLITKAGGGILIPGTRQQHMEQPEITVEAVRKAVLELMNNPKETKKMGIKARKEIEKNWTWDKFIPNWRKFFQKGIANAYAAKNLG